MAKKVTKKKVAKKRTAKKPAVRKATKKVAKKKAAKLSKDFDGPGPKSKPKGKPGTRIKEPFPLSVCKKLCNLVHDKHEDKEKLSDLKAQRKDLRNEIREDQNEIDLVVSEEEKAGRGKGQKPFTAAASKKIAGLQKDINRRSKKAGTLAESIADLRDKIRENQSLCDSTISGQDPAGTLFEGAPASSKDGE